MKFAKVSLQCLGCKSILPSGRVALCVSCNERAADVYYTKMTTAIEAEGNFHKLWTQCQRCQGDLHKDVLCASRDCPIFYKRKKVQRDLKEARDLLERFDGNEW